MTLAAMMVGSRGFANVVTLATTDTWVATVTGTVFVTMASPGGAAGPNTNPSPAVGGGGGGGGAYLHTAPLSVVTGDTIATTIGSIFAISTVTMQRNGTPIGSIAEGEGADQYSDGRGGRGGAVSWTPLGVSVSGGNGGTFSPSFTAQNGGQVQSNGGTFMSGGGGGSGNTVSPPANGFFGGFGGIVYPPAPPVSFWGGGGGGFQPGSARFGANVNEVTSLGSWIIRIEW